MRQWTPPQRSAGALAAELMGALGLPAFRRTLLEQVRQVVPAASCAVYRLGPRPALLLSGSLDIPDTTRQCWNAYLSGPHRRDVSLGQRGETAGPGQRVCHVTATEVPAEHRARVYEPHGVLERVSVVEPDPAGSLFAVNFYRHSHQRPFTDAQLAGFGEIAPAVLAAARRHVALAAGGSPPALSTRVRLQQLCPALTVRELDICERLVQGMTQDGIAAELGLGVPTVKTYRSRAFARLGIHWRHQLSALLVTAQA